MQVTAHKSALVIVILGALAAASAQENYSQQNSSSQTMPSSASDTLGTRDSATLGTFLTASDGRTLYIFTKDTPGVSNCYDQCAVNWPPLLSATLPKLPAGAPGTLSLVKRKDGASQVAYNGMPLYLWIKDAKAGDTTGQNVGSVWFTANLEPTVTVGKNADLGNFIVGPNGMTLYLYTKDAPDVSNCYDQCAKAWPPLLVSHTPVGTKDLKGKLGTTKRKDGALQVTYNGMPLYYWVKDTKPGDATGQNVGGVWFVLKP